MNFTWEQNTKKYEKSKYGIYFGILKMFLKKKLFKRNEIVRNEVFVTREYSKRWADKHDEMVEAHPRLEKFDDRLVLVRSIDHRKFLISYINDVVNSIHPKTVLEVGSGNGLNVLALAVVNPKLKKIVGIELTDNGIEFSKLSLANPPIEALKYLTGQDEQLIKKRLMETEIDFVKGNILNMQFTNNSFDFAFSCVTIEQIPRDYLKAFSEINRVVRGHALFLEAFKEAQENIFNHLYLVSKDYFRASFKEVEKAGLQILKLKPLRLRKLKFRTAGLLCKTS